MLVKLQKVAASIGLVVVILGVTISPAFASQEEAPRKVTRKVKPIYPPLARPLHLVGNVRLSVVVGPDGKVKTIKVIGGHPLLAAAADQAVRQWLYEAGPKESNELLTFLFDQNATDAK